jgi:hypothetical protein
LCEEFNEKKICVVGLGDGSWTLETCQGPQIRYFGAHFSSIDPTTAVGMFDFIAILAGTCQAAPSEHHLSGVAFQIKLLTDNAAESIEIYHWLIYLLLFLSRESSCMRLPQIQGNVKNNKQSYLKL